MKISELSEGIFKNIDGYVYVVECCENGMKKVYATHLERFLSDDEIDGIEVSNE